MVTRTDKPDKTGLSHTHGLKATDDQLKAEAEARNAGDLALSKGLTAVEGRVTALEKPVPPPVDPPKPPDIPGPEPGGTQPPNNVDRTGKTDTTAALLAFLEGPAKKIDLGLGTYLVSQLASTTLRDKEIYDGMIKQSKVLVQNGPGKDSSLVWLQSGTGGLWFSGITFQGAYAGRPAGSDGKTLPEEYNHAVKSQGTQGLILVNCAMQDFGGDGVSVGGWLPSGAPQSADITVQDCFIIGCGRMAIALAGGASRVHIIHNEFDRCGWTASLVIEPNGDAPGGKPELYSLVEFLANRIGRGNSAKYSLVLTNSSNHGGNPVTISGITAKDNKTIYADNPWNPFIYDPWKSAVTQSGNGPA